jgi:RNA polymerase sigma factor (sigma-70 family)
VAAILASTHWSDWALFVFHSARTNEAKPPHLSVVRNDSALPQPHSLETLFVQHASHLRRMLFNLVGRRTDVDDLVQDVFVKALGCLDSLKEPKAARAWLSAMAVRMGVRRLKRRRFRQRFHIDVDEGDLEQVSGHGVAADDRALVSRLFQLLDGVPAGVLA